MTIALLYKSKHMPRSTPSSSTSGIHSSPYHNRIRNLPQALRSSQREFSSKTFAVCAPQENAQMPAVHFPAPLLAAMLVIRIASPSIFRNNEAKRAQLVRCVGDSASVQEAKAKKGTTEVIILCVHWAISPHLMLKRSFAGVNRITLLDQVTVVARACKWNFGRMAKTPSPGRTSGFYNTS